VSLKGPTEELIALVGSVNLATDANRDFLQSLVDTLRVGEVSWAEIGAALGLSHNRPGNGSPEARRRPATTRAAQLGLTVARRRPQGLRASRRIG
jgi:hypothetical protein